MERHSADTLAWRFAVIQAQKNRRKGRFQYLLQKEEDGTSGRALIGPTLGRHACVAIC